DRHDLAVLGLDRTALATDFLLGPDAGCDGDPGSSIHVGVELRDTPDVWPKAGLGAGMKPIVIVDYGMGNLRSVQKAFEKLGHAAAITSEPNRIAEAAKVVLPGVGAFRDAIAR